jgi:hypothetical protein
MLRHTLATSPPYHRNIIQRRDDIVTKEEANNTMSDSGNPLPPADLDKVKEHMNTMMRSGNPLPEEIQELINSAIKKRLEQDEKEKAKKAPHNG